MSNPIQNTPRATTTLALALLSGASFMAMSSGVQAAEERSSARVIEEVVVTARRVEEDTQTVPLTVTVVSPLMMEQENIIRPTELMYTVPSVTVAPSFNTLNNGYRVRGLAAGVAIYFSEAPCCTANSSIPFMDIRSVQVLNGPQGTLFGRSSGSGSILIEPVRPSLSATSGDVKVRFGDYGRKEFSGAVSKSLIEDRLAVRLAVTSLDVNGFTKQIGGGEKLDEKKSQQARLGVLFENGRFENYTALNYINLDQTASNEVLASINTGIGLYNLPPAAGPAVLGTACAGAVSIGLSTDVDSCVAQRMDMLAGMKASFIAEMDRINAGGDSAIRSTPATVFDNPNFLRLKDWSVVNVATFHELPLGPVVFTLKDVFSYEEIVNNTGNPADGIGGAAEQAGSFNTAGVGANNTSNGKVVSQLGPRTEIINNDLQVNFDVKDGLVTGTLGFYYVRAEDPATDKGTGNIYQIFGGVLNPDLGYNSALDFVAGNRRSQRAWYTQSTLDASRLGIGIEGLKITAGYRYSWSDVFTSGRQPVFDLATGSYSPSATTREESTEDEGYNYLFSVAEEFTDDFMAYVSVSRAFIPGGLNRLIQDASNLPNYKPVYDPQIVVTTEVGAKWDFDIGNMPARLNATVYDYDFTDIAVGFSGFTGTVSIGYTANVAAAELQGFELTGAIKPTDDWELRFGYNYNDAEYTKWTASDPHNAASPGDAICSPLSQPQTCLIDLTDNPFPRMPEHQGHVTAVYYAPINPASGHLYLSASVYRQSLVWYNSSARRMIEVLPTAKPGISQSSYSIVNLRADWNDVMGTGYDASIFINNATDEVYALGKTPQLLTLGFSVATYAPPRMMGIEISKSF